MKLCFHKIFNTNEHELKNSIHHRGHGELQYPYSVIPEISNRESITLDSCLHNAGMTIYPVSVLSVVN